MRTINSRALTMSLGRQSRRGMNGLRGLGAADQILAARQIELDQVRAERVAVEAEIEDLKRRAAARVAARNGVVAREQNPLNDPAAPFMPPSPDLVPPLVSAPGDVVDLTPPSMLERVSNAPTIVLAGAGLVALLVLRGLFKGKG